jgi:hypothetical protein
MRTNLDDVEWQRVWDSYQDGTASFDKDGKSFSPERNT